MLRKIVVYFCYKTFPIIRFIKYSCILVVLFSVLTERGISQHIFFRQLGLNEGLNSSGFWHTALDKNGFIWFTSTDGLFFYDGYNFSQYTRETHPQLPSNLVTNITCDSRNRIWIQTGAGIAMIDENRRLTKVTIPGYVEKESLDQIVFEAPGAGIIAVNPFGSFISKNGLHNWKPFPWLDSLLGNKGIVDIDQFGPTTMILSQRDARVLVIDFVQQEVLLNQELPGAMGICKLNEEEILAGTDHSWGLYRIHVARKKITTHYAAPLNTKGKPVASGIVSMTPASDGNIYITTRSNGLVRLNPSSESFDLFSHDPLDPTSPSTNSLRMIAADEAGLLVMTTPLAVHFTNVNYSMMKSRLFFNDNSGGIIDHPVYSITSDGKDNIYIAASSHLIQWNRQTNESVELVNYEEEHDAVLPANSIFSLEMDERKYLWAAVRGRGIQVWDKRLNRIAHLKLGKQLSDSWLRMLKTTSKGFMMAGTEKGLFLINQETFKIDSVSHPLLHSTLLKKRIIDIYTRGEEAWIAVSPRGGVYHYNFSTRKMEVYTVKEGLISDRVYSITVDKEGSLYAGTRSGLSIIHHTGKIINLDKSNGLAHSRVEAIKTDDSGYVWLANTSNISRYDPVTGKLNFFNEQNGISNTWFNIGSAHKSPGGELYFGTGRGLVYFKPSSIRPYTPPVKLFVHRSADGRDFISSSSESSLSFPFREAKMIFRFSGSDITNNHRLFFRHKMEGLDTGWSELSKTPSIAYNLRPGKYRFLVKATYDRSEFIAYSEPIEINVSWPLWQRTWFRLLLLAFLLSGIIVYYRIRMRNIQKKAAMQQQLAEMEGKALRAQMNPHFVFNSLNAIQECVVTGKTDAAYEYLSKFSRLLRLVLTHSDKNFLHLSQELEMLELYLSLESLRFRQSFEYFIEADEALYNDTLQVPSMIIQPFVENALWHGLRLKEGDKKLWIRIFSQEQKLVIEIEDNGIGRQRSAWIKQQKLGSEQIASRGIDLSRQRISLLNRGGESQASLTIHDLRDEGGNATGTRVIIEIRNSGELNESSKIRKW